MINTGMAMIHERIKKRISDLSLSQAGVAKKVGVSRAAVNAWTMKPTKIYGDHLVKLCEVLECDLMWLLTGKGSTLRNAVPKLVEVAGKGDVDHELLRLSIEFVENGLFFRGEEATPSQKAVMVLRRYDLGLTPAPDELKTVFNNTLGSAEGGHS